jgi:hypothetical protein
MDLDTEMNFSIKDVAPRVGSEIRTDKETLLGGKRAQQIRDLLEHRGVMVFPEINLANVYRHHWQVSDMVIWDNTGTLHRALPYDHKSGRLMHRTKLQGEEAFT